MAFPAQRYAVARSKPVFVQPTAVNHPQSYPVDSRRRPPETKFSFEDFEAQESQDKYIHLASAEVRRGFVKKVFGILSVQLLFTFTVVLICTAAEPVRAFVDDNPGIFILSFIVGFGALLVLLCVGDVRRKYPQNYIFLGVFTVAESYMLGAISAKYETTSVVLAIGFTLLVSLSMMLLAATTKVDITSWGPYLMVALIVLITTIIFGGLIPGIESVDVFIAGGAALLFSIFIVYDTQLILGGKKHAISEEEYVYASLSLYLDIINLFLWLLYLIGGVRQ